MAMSEAEWVPRVGETIRGTPLQGEIASLQSNINSDKPHSVTIQLTPETHQEIADGAYINYKLTDEILFAAAYLDDWPEHQREVLKKIQDLGLRVGSDDMFSRNPEISFDEKI